MKQDFLWDDLVIREAEADDYKKIFQLTEKAFKKYEQKISGADRDHLQETVCDVKEDIDRQVVLILEKKDTAVGCLRLKQLSAMEELTSEGLSSFRRKAGGEFLLRRFAIDPDLQGQGYGSILLEAAEDRVKAEGGEKIYLFSSLENKRLTSFYRRHGFSCLLVDENKGYRRGLWEKYLKTGADENETMGRPFSGRN